MNKMHWHTTKKLKLTEIGPHGENENDENISVSANFPVCL